MAKCNSCGKRGLFLALENGKCADCVAKEKLLAKQKAEEERRILESSPSFLLNKYRRRYIPRPCMYRGASRAYTYFIPLSNVDRDTIYQMTQIDTFDVSMQITSEGSIALMNEDTAVAFLADKISIASDWIKKELPYICQLAEFGEGKERAVLHLFRNDESKYSGCKVEIAKLTSYMSEEKQFNISVLEPGERLFVEEDDNGKWYVRNVDYHELGRLPAKFNKLFDNDSLRAMFFDHGEMTENANGHEIEVPYVRFYFD